MLACAALSARPLIEAAAIDGLQAIALDLFGDVDTQRLAAGWLPIGDAATLSIDGDRFLGALHQLARRGDMDGWVAGSGFDGRPDLLDQGAASLPLIGSPAAAVRAVRDPRRFFGLLQAQGIHHPAVRFAPPEDPAGWLLKDAGSCGGGSVICATSAAPAIAASGRYWQRECPGRPMSATFIANGRDACVLGFNLQTVTPLGDRPFVFRGVIGPVPVSEPVRRDIAAAIGAIVRDAGLLGLGSLDFMLDGEIVQVLEVNPRPPASISLYPQVGHGGPLSAHWRACVQQELPEAPPHHGIVRGSTIVFAPAAMTLDNAAAARIHAWPGACDLPRSGLSFAAGDPLCSLAAQADSADAVHAVLEHQRGALLTLLETDS